MARQVGKSQNTKSTDKPKRKAPSTAWKPGQSGNPGGRPLSQHSLSYWLKEFGNTSPNQLADLFQAYALELRKGGDLPFFALLAVRLLMSASNEPDVALLALLFDRTEGRLTERSTDVPWDEEVKKWGIEPDTVRQAIGPLFAKVPVDVHESDD